MRTTHFKVDIPLSPRIAEKFATLASTIISSRYHLFATVINPKLGAKRNDNFPEALRVGTFEYASH